MTASAQAESTADDARKVVSDPGGEREGADSARQRADERELAEASRA